MKKNVRKLLSLALALMMLLSILPMAVFAAEKEDEVEPAAACNHSYHESMFYTYSNVNSTYHFINRCYERVCLLCGYVKYDATPIIMETHTFSAPVFVGITTTEDGENLYTYEQTCTLCGGKAGFFLENPL